MRWPVKGYTIDAFATLDRPEDDAPRETRTIRWCLYYQGDKLI
jgi:hypothetical protein